MEGGGYSSSSSSTSPFIHLSNIGKHESTDEILTIANSAFFTIFLVILSARIGGLGGFPLNTYFEIFGLEGIVSCVALIVILFQTTRYFYSTFYGTYERSWSPLVFICMLLGVQAVYDLAFYYGVVNTVKKGQNHLLDIIRSYVNSNQLGALGGHSVFMVLTALVAMILNESSDVSKWILFGVVAFAVPYVLSIQYAKPVVVAPPPPKTEPMKDVRGFY
jgi:hypothetical protein